MHVLKELFKRWSNHKIMVRWLSRFFDYLDRYFIVRRSLPPLQDVGMTCFRDLVYKELHSRAKDVVIELVSRRVCHAINYIYIYIFRPGHSPRFVSRQIHEEREGGQIDRALLKNVLDIYVETGMDQYQKDFEVLMFKDSTSYYSRKASSWIREDSCPEYMQKAEECLKKEKERVAHYLHSTTEAGLVAVSNKLLNFELIIFCFFHFFNLERCFDLRMQAVQKELLVDVAKELLDKEHSGCRALLRDDKVAN